MPVPNRLSTRQRKTTHASGYCANIRCLVSQCVLAVTPPCPHSQRRDGSIAPLTWPLASEHHGRTG